MKTAVLHAFAKPFAIVVLRIRSLRVADCKLRAPCNINRF
jgi:hypothetical protein